MKTNKTNTERKINVAVIIALALIAVCTSPEALTQMFVFIALVTVVFGRDRLLQKLSRSQA